jgi:hypothetical protein
MRSPQFVGSGSRNKYPLGLTVSFGGLGAKQHVDTLCMQKAPGLL